MQITQQENFLDTFIQWVSDGFRYTPCGTLPASFVKKERQTTTTTLPEQEKTIVFAGKRWRSNNVQDQHAVFEYEAIDTVYQASEELSKEEIALLKEKGLELDKAKLIKPLVGRIEDGKELSNKDIAKKLKAAHGRGYGERIVSDYAAVIRSVKSNRGRGVVKMSNAKNAKNGKTPINTGV